MRPEYRPLPSHVRVRVIDTDGPHAADSEYARRWYVSLVGPTAMCLLQLLVSEPGTWFVPDLASRLGLHGAMNSTRSNNPLLNALGRLEMFRLVERLPMDNDDVVVVRSHLPALDPGAVARLTVNAQKQLADYEKAGVT